MQNTHIEIQGQGPRDGIDNGQFDRPKSTVGNKHWALCYNGDEERIWIFKSFLKDGSSIAFAAWWSSQGENLPWNMVIVWAIESWRKPLSECVVVYIDDILIYSKNELE